MFTRSNNPESTVDFATLIFKSTVEKLALFNAGIYYEFQRFPPLERVLLLNYIGDGIKIFDNGEGDKQKTKQDKKNHKNKTKNCGLLTKIYTTCGWWYLHFAYRNRFLLPSNREQFRSQALSDIMPMRMETWLQLYGTVLYSRTSMIHIIWWSCCGFAFAVDIITVYGAKPLNTRTRNWNLNLNLYFDNHVLVHIF